MSEFKNCTKCNELLPSTIEYFSPRKRNKNGLHELCRKCRLERDRTYKQANKEMYKEIRQKWTEENREKLNLQNKVYREIHKERKSETNRLWHIKNKDKKNEQVKIWTKENKDRKIQTITEWRKSNPEKYGSILKKYRQNNKEKCLMWAQKRRSKQKALPATLTLNEWKIIKEYFNNKCAYCGENKKLEQDHFIALNSGGEYTINNIVPACRRCNCSKKDKTYEEWIRKQDFYDMQRHSKIINRKYKV